jgi:hypothetical protein
MSVQRSIAYRPLLGDKGSGYQIGYEILNAVVRALDGRGPATSLVEAVFAQLNFTKVPPTPLSGARGVDHRTSARSILIARGDHQGEEIIPWAYSSVAWERYAQLAPLAAIAARNGDKGSWRGTTWSPLLTNDPTRLDSHNYSGREDLGWPGTRPGGERSRGRQEAQPREPTLPGTPHHFAHALKPLGSPSHALHTHTQLVLAGGNFTHEGSYLTALLKRQIAEQVPQATVLMPTLSPEYAAALLALNSRKH